MLSDEELKDMISAPERSYADHSNPAFTRNQVEQVARAVERATIERCAKVCKEISVDRWNQYKGRSPYGPACSGRADPGIQGQSMGADDCEIAILAMLEEKP